MNAATARLAAANKRRAQERDRRILRLGRAINVWADDLADRLIGMATAQQPQLGILVEVVVAGALDRLTWIMEDHLTGLVRWAYDSAADALLRALPVRFWALRAARAGVRESIQEELNLDIEIQRILDGAVSRSEALRIIRTIEFPPLSADRVRRILRGSYDGIDAMSRIKTVAQPLIGELRRRIVAGMSDPDEASAMRSVAASIRELVGNDPGKPTGMNYRALRIARTEGMRISEAAARETMTAHADLLKGIRTQRTRSEPCDLCDPHDDVLYVQQPGGGDYLDAQGRRLPDFPLHPNCMCYATPELLDDLTAGLPAANYGADYARSAARAEIEAGY